MADARKPSVLFLIGSMREGGAEGQVVHLLRGLRARGWRVGVMLLHPEGVRLEALRAEGFEIFPVALPRFRPRWNPLPWLRLVGAWWRTRRFLREWQPDVLHAWLFWAHLWAWLTIPRGVVLLTSRRQTWSDKKDSALLTAIENRINGRARLVIANSQRVADSCREKEQGLDGKLRVIANGLDLAAFDAAPAADLRALFPGAAPTDPVAITVANVLPHKGYPVLLAAWAEVVKRHPGARLACVGQGTAEAIAALQADAPTLRDNVRFLGSRRDVPALLKGATLAAHASLDEGLSNAVLEYMAAGLPIAATDVGGTAESLAGNCGIVVKPGSAPELAAALLKILDDKAQAATLGQAARRRIEDVYTLEALIAAHERLYREISG